MVGTRTFITMTTVPERLVDPWFEQNLRHTLSIIGEGKKLLLQIPPTSAKDGTLYVVPDTIHDLESSVFEINYVEVDEGPITKLLPALRDKRIRDDDIIIVCDDDIVYRKDVFCLLTDSVHANPNNVSCMCNDTLEGFKGFGCRKHMLLGLLNVEIPLSSRYVDDWIIAEFLSYTGVDTVSVAYEGDTDWSCSLDVERTDTHPEWAELINDDRESTKDSCLQDIRRALFLYPLNSSI